MQTTSFLGEFDKQQRIARQLSTKLCHSRFRWVKLFPQNPANISPASFHAEVDNKGWTVVVGILGDGSVIGGFTSVSWTSAPAPLTLSDPYAFLFSLPHNGTEVFFPASAGLVQVSHNAAEGPSFGAKELYFSLAASHAGSECKTLVNFTTPVANGDGVVADLQNPATAWTPGAGTKQLVAVEAYQIVPAEYPLPVKPTNNQKMLTLLTNEFKTLKKLGLEKVHICFVGDAKSGKSTTINNLISALSAARRLQTHAFATNLNDHGTTCYAKYPLDLVGELVDGLEHLPISMNDTPGFTAVYIDKIETLIPFIAQGRVPEGWKLSDNPAFLPLHQGAEDEWIHLFVIIIPADAINNPVKMEHYRRIERAIRTDPPNSANQAFPKFPNVVYLVTQMDEPARGGDVLLSSHPSQFDASELWAGYKKKLKTPQALGNADAYPIVNVCEQFQEIPETHLSVLYEAWLRILSAVRTNVSRWKK
jgi:hypothetical protein